MKKEQYDIIEALQTEPMLTAYAIGKLVNLSPSQVSNFMKPLQDAGVVKVVQDETTNNGKTLFFISKSATDDFLDVFAEQFVDLVEMIAESDEELDVPTGIGAILDLALNKIEIS